MNHANPTAVSAAAAPPEDKPAVLMEKLTREQISPAVLTSVVKPIELVTQRVSQGKLTGESGEASFALAYAMSFVLYLALLIYGMQVMTSRSSFTSFIKSVALAASTRSR